MKLQNYLISFIVFACVAVGIYFLVTEPINENSDGANQALSLGDNLTEDSRKATAKPRPQLDEIMVYETEADSIDECSSYEDYDEVEKVCFYECENEAECNEIEDAVNNELEGWTEEMANDKEPISEAPLAEDDEKMVAKYVVAQGEKITFKSGKDLSEYRKIWDEIAALSPNLISDKYIESFEIYDDVNNDSLAFVEDGDGNGKWRIAVNFGARKNETLRQQKATLVHELGHIITLNISQVTPPAKTCANLDLPEGCATTNSYVNTFYNKYWKGVKAPAAFTESKFVTEYAASESVEDLAESFAFFVLEKDKEKLGNEIKDQKLKHFYQFPELVEMRKDMRQVLGREIVRAKKLVK